MAYHEVAAIAHEGLFVRSMVQGRLGELIVANVHGVPARPPRERPAAIVSDERFAVVAACVATGMINREMPFAPEIVRPYLKELRTHYGLSGLGLSYHAERQLLIRLLFTSSAALPNCTDPELPAMLTPYLSPREKIAGGLYSYGLRPAEVAEATGLYEINAHRTIVRLAGKLGVGGMRAWRTVGAAFDRGCFSSANQDVVMHPSDVIAGMQVIRGMNAGDLVIPEGLEQP